MEQYVYIVECRDHSLYTGWTNHLRERIEPTTGEEGPNIPEAGGR